MRTALLAILIAAALWVPAHAADPDAYRQMIAQQKQQQEMYLKRMELLPGKKKIEDILRVVNEHGKLVMKSPLFEADAANRLRNRQVRVEVEGFEGYCTLMVQPITRDLYYFTFANMAYPDLEGMSNFQINAQPGYVQISRSFNSLTKNFTINLIQSEGREVFGQADGVQLGIYGGENNGRATVSVSVSEPDFATLRRKHPREVDQHLRPLLRDLKLQNLFAVEPIMAWQVFSQDWKGNPAVAARITTLLPEMEADDYHQRDAAHQELRKLGPEAALVIYRMNRESLTTEQNTQLDTILAEYSFMSRPEAHRLLRDVEFLLDCLYSDDEQVRATAVKHLRATTHREIAFDTKDDEQNRAARIEALRAELNRGATTRPVP
jgi:hypothetical protein